LTRLLPQIFFTDNMITGNTQLIAHIGFPTHAFKAPMIYNPYFEEAGIDVVVVPMSCQPAHFKSLIQSLCALGNLRGALITMPHKTSMLELLDVVSPTALIAGACNAVRCDEQGRMIGDMFDGEGFVRGISRKGFAVKGSRALVVGGGGVGSAIAASLAGAGVATLALFDLDQDRCDALAGRLRKAYPDLEVSTGSNDPHGFDLVVNATPMGMVAGDPLPVDVERLQPETWVGEVVMKTEMTAFLTAAQALGCRVQVGTDMLFEQIPAYLEFFGLPVTSAEELRRLAKLQYS
jgi:shikimate dehydrogenase